MEKLLAEISRAKEDNPGVRVFRPQPLRPVYLFPCAIHLASQGLAGCVGFILIFFCESSGCPVGLWGRSGIQGSRFEVSHFVFLGKVELGVPKLGHLKVQKGSGREPGEDNEGIRIRLERLDCNQTAWEDSGLPSLRTESQVDSSGKYYPLTTNRPGAIRSGSL